MTNQIVRYLKLLTKELNEIMGIHRRISRNMMAPEEIERIDYFNSLPLYRRDISRKMTELPGAENLMALPSVLPEAAQNLERIFQSRRSSRPEDRRGTQSLMLEELAAVLKLGYGCHPQSKQKRYPPAAGGLYNLSYFICVKNIEGLEPGLYSYEPFSHSIRKLTKARIDVGSFYRNYLNEEKDPAAVLILTGIPEHKVLKYGFLGYKLMLLDAGHSLQNAWLAASSLNIPVQVLSGMLNDSVIWDLGLSPQNEIYMNSMCLFCKN